MSLRGHSRGHSGQRSPNHEDQHCGDDVGQVVLQIAHKIRKGRNLQRPDRGRDRVNEDEPEHDGAD
jgi:hypothetical protein